MIRRPTYAAQVERSLRYSPAVVLLGARQVGKTTFSKSLLGDRPLSYFDLESPSTLKAIQNDPEQILDDLKDSLVVLDEVQEYPKLFSVLRSVIDNDRRNGRFLLLGSANPALIRGVSESLAGRIAYVEMPPFLLSEVGYEHQKKHWLRGGIPLSYLADDDEAAWHWTRDYIRSYVERDVNALFHINLNTSIVRRLWTMLAHLNGSTLNAADIARSLGISANTVNRYIDILEAAYLIYRIKPFFVNVSKRLVKSPKVYISDTGVLHHLMGIKSYEDLLTHPIIGTSWEGYVVNQIRHLLPDDMGLYFYRTHAGTEMDAVLVKGEKPIASIEIKNSNNPTITKGFYIATEDLRTEHNYIITKDNSFVSPRGVRIVSLHDFMKDELPQLIDFEKI